MKIAHVTATFPPHIVGIGVVASHNAADLNDDGAYDRDEQRNPRYNVIAGNTFAGLHHRVLDLYGYQNLVPGNVVERRVYMFAGLYTRCSTRWYQRGNVYRDYDSVIAENRVADLNVFLAVDQTLGPRCGATADPAVVAQNAGRLGRYTVRDNQLVNNASLEALVKDLGSVDGPNLLVNNCLNGACSDRP